MHNLSTTWSAWVNPVQTDSGSSFLKQDCTAARASDRLPPRYAAGSARPSGHSHAQYNDCMPGSVMVRHRPRLPAWPVMSVARWRQKPPLPHTHFHKRSPAWRDLSCQRSCHRRQILPSPQWALLWNSARRYWNTLPYPAPVHSHSFRWPVHDPNRHNQYHRPIRHHPPATQCGERAGRLPTTNARQQVKSWLLVLLSGCPPADAAQRSLIPGSVWHPVYHSQKLLLIPLSSHPIIAGRHSIAYQQRHAYPIQIQHCLQTGNYSMPGRGLLYSSTMAWWAGCRHK